MFEKVLACIEVKRKKTKNHKRKQDQKERTNSSLEKSKSVYEALSFSLSLHQSIYS